MEGLDFISIIISAISLLGVLLSSLHIAFKIGALSERVSNHDRELAKLEKTKVTKDAFDNFTSLLEEVRADVKKISNKKND